MTYEEQQRLLRENLKKREEFKPVIVLLEKALEAAKLVIRGTYAYERELCEKKFDLKTGEEIEGEKKDE